MRRLLLLLALVFSASCQKNFATEQDESPPNIVLILCDNLGYGDVGCFGSKNHRTPNIDRMAAEGIRFTSFYSASGVCTPSRAALMTGCYPRRVGMDLTDPDGHVLRPVSPNGLHPNEITIAEILKKQGYVTTCIGKWHLGDQRPFLPTRQGFDSYFGIPYSDDMTPRPNKNWPKLPLMENERVIEAPVDRNQLTKRYTERAIKFIENNKSNRFFLYLPHAMPGSTRAPYASERFRGKSANGPFGDSVEEIDWSTGEILAALKRLKLDKNTLVIWTSDNGAPRREPIQGSNAPLGGWGYSTMEGGMRVPCVMRWPGKIPSEKSTDEIATLMDLLPTFARLAAGNTPADRIIDGHDIRPLMTVQEGSSSPYEAFYYFHRDTLHAVRSGIWKLHLPASLKQNRLTPADKNSTVVLYDLFEDAGENNDVSGKHPAIVKRLLALAERAREDLGDGQRNGKNERLAGRVIKPTPQVPQK